MYLKRITLTDIKSFHKLDWKLPPEADLPGWHVIIGDNGAGKTSFLRSTALALVGLEDAFALPDEDWKDWVQREKETAQIVLELTYDLMFDEFYGNPPLEQNLHMGLSIKRLPQVKKFELVPIRFNNLDPKRFIWGGYSGWFSAAYGPFRRFAGGDSFYTGTLYNDSRFARHMSLFREGVALTESMKWLQELHYKQLEEQQNGHATNGFLSKLREFINQEGFLPFHTRLSNISSDGVEFEDGNGAKVWLEDLSDGYRSILSMTFELIRQLTLAYDPEAVFDRNDPPKIGVPGVVLIDEVDVHLHPTWQKKVGLWMREHFPYIQFIVTTHSPLVCQAANVGTVYRLPQPGSDESGAFVTGIELDRLLYGNVLDAYSTGLFGDSSRSEEGKRRLKRLAELNQRELHSGLTVNERREQEELRAGVPTEALRVQGA